MQVVSKFLARKEGEGEQTGINMVDLMMWLVIASLLLAAAIQGIGYYQQNAYVYQMKSALDAAQSHVFASASSDGNLNVSVVDAVIAEENAAHPDDDITLTVGAIDLTAAGEAGNNSGFELASVVTATTVGAGQTYYIRAVHTAVTNYDVIDMLKDTATKKAGIYLVNKGTTSKATPGGSPSPSATATGTASATATPSATTTATSSATATVTPTPTPTATVTPTPTPTPTPAPTRPADVNATGVTIVGNGGYPSYWTDKTVSAAASNYSASYGFSITQVNSATAAANYTVVFSGGENVGAGSYPQSSQTGNGYMWVGTVYPVAGGFTPGTGYITATITDKTTGAVSKKSWILTVNPAAGPVQGSYYSSYWTDKSAPSLTSNSSAVFGFRIPFATATDYTVTYAGDASINANVSAVQFLNGDNGGGDWYAVAVPVAGGFKEGAGVITATVKHNVTGQTWTKKFNLTITPTPGPVPGNYYGSYWSDKTATVGSTSGKVFGFAIKGAASSDFTVVFTSTGTVNESLSATQFTSADGADWYDVVGAKAGGFTAGTSTITATITHKLTGKVFTKTWTLTVS